MKRPTEQEIAFYMEEKGMAIGRTNEGVPIIKEEQDEAFLDYFESNGWKVGKNQMKSWKAAVRTWLRNYKKWGNKNGTSQQSNQTHAQRQHQQAQDAHKQMELEHTESYSGIVRQIQ